MTQDPVVPQPVALYKRSVYLIGCPVGYQVVKLPIVVTLVCIEKSEVKTLEASQAE